MRGVQQGDPLGPALFALAIHDAILKARDTTERALLGQLDFTAFYLDDGVVAGTAAAVSLFSTAFKAEAENLGLSMAVGKCEVIPAAGQNFSFDPAMFQGWQWKVDGCFKLLGAAFGNEAHCTALTTKRVTKTAALLEELSRYGHTQGAVLLLRHCGSWGKLVYSSRTVPPCLHKQALVGFKHSLRKALEDAIGDTLPERSWLLAQLGLAQGGLGIRDPTTHAAAAYLASLSQTQELCVTLDRQYDVADRDGGLHKADTEADFKAMILESAAWTGSSQLTSQKVWSNLLDAAARKRLLEDNSADALFGAHVALCSVPGAAAWLTAMPNQDGREIDAPLFKVALKRRLRVPVFSRDGFCPCCGQVLDKWGDHALTCACSGDRTIRHNAIRNSTYEDTAYAGLRPVREKAGLLPSRPKEDGIPSPVGRRPADVWVPRGNSGGGEAWDFAVSSGMRSDLFRACTEAPELVFLQYERHKLEYKDTAKCCDDAGFRFIPLILEAHGGGFSPTLRGVVDWVARQAAAAHNEVPGSVSLKIAQRISCALHRGNARAILKRALLPEAEPQPSGWEVPAADEQG